MIPSEKYSHIDQIAEDFAARLRRGERPTFQEYVDRHPELAGEIRELFPALVEMERVDVGPGLFDSAVPSLRQVGDYRIIREVGRGGMGVVYEAEQQSLGRRVALKIMPGRISRDHTTLERFKREARTAAQLHHTNIVPVFDVGQDRETCYYAMQFIQGQGLDQVVVELCRLRSSAARETDRPSQTPDQNAPSEAAATGSLATSMLTGKFSIAATTPLGDQLFGAIPTRASKADAEAYSAALPGQTDRSTVQTSHGHYFRSVARIGEQAAAALSYAHQRGIVHRDIKPSNLLLDTAGTVWITDFGLAKTDDEGLTQSGDVLGTFRYMAPERFSGLGDARGDLYSLGLTLYELLLLRPAFDSPDRLRLIEQVKQCQAPPPRSLDPRVPRDLETIVLKAMDREPKRRYQSADQLCDDLRRFLAGEPIKARRTGELERLRLWCRRNPTVATMTGALAVLLLVLAIGATVSALWLREERDLAVTNEGRAISAEQAESNAKREALAKLWDSSLLAARAGRMSRSSGQRFGSLRAIEQALALPLPPGRSKDELRTEAIASLLLPDMEVQKDWSGWPSGSRGLAVDNACQRYARSDAHGNVSVRRIADDEELIRLPGLGPSPDTYEVLTFSPDGRFLNQICEGNQRRIWKLDGQRPAIVLAGNYAACAFSPDSRRAAVAYPDDSIRLYDLKTARELNRYQFDSFKPFRLAWNPRQPLLAACDRSAYRLIDLTTGESQAEVQVPGGISWADWHPDGRLLAVGAGEYDVHPRIMLWDTATSRLALPPMEGHKTQGLLMRFNHAGDRLVSTDWSHVWRFWDVRTGQMLLTQPAGGNGIWFSQDDRVVGLDASASHLRLFRFQSGKEFCTLIHPGSSTSRGYHLGYCQLDAEGRLLAILAGDGLAVVDVVRGEEVALIPFGDNHPLGTDHSGALLTHGSVGLLRWPLTLHAGEQYRSYGPAERLAPPMTGLGQEPGCSADARIFAFPRLGDGACELQLPEGKQIALAPQEDVRHCAVSPDGSWIATGSHTVLKGPGAKVWDARTGQHAHNLHVGEYCPVSFSPAGKWLLTTGGGARIWSVGTWRQGPSLGDSAVGAAFTADDALMAIQDVPGVVRLVVPDSGREIARLTAPVATGLNPLFFTRDGTRLICVSAETEAIYIFHLDPIRRQLAAMGLDWDAPAFSAVRESHPEAFEIQFIDHGTVDSTRVDEIEIVNAALMTLLSPWNADAHLQLGIRLTEAKQEEVGDSELQLALALRPDLPEARSSRAQTALRTCGDWNVRQERWQRAATDFVLLADLQPTKSEVGLQAAALLLTAGDRAGYREFCRRLVRRFQNTANPNDAERTAKACLITDELKDELPEISRLAQFAVQKGASSGDRLWFELAAEMAEYRQQQYDAVLKRFDRNHKSIAGLPVLEELSSLFEAMALQKLGHTAEARRLFDSAFPAVDQHFGRRPDDLNWDWHDGLLARIVCEEAQRLLSETPAAAK